MVPNVADESIMIKIQGFGILLNYFGSPFLGVVRLAASMALILRSIFFAVIIGKINDGLVETWCVWIRTHQSPKPWREGIMFCKRLRKLVICYESLLELTSLHPRYQFGGVAQVICCSKLAIPCPLCISLQWRTSTWFSHHRTAAIQELAKRAFVSVCA